MADFFFFTEVDLLDSQTILGAFGPSGTINGMDQFRTSSLHSSSGTPKAYAVCDGMVCVQQDINPLLVNIILRPKENSDINLPEIKYFIYKGILKSSLFDNNEDVLVTNDNQLTTSIKTSWDAYLASIESEILPIPNKALGFHLDDSEEHFSDEDLIDNLFYMDYEDFQLPNVKGGWTIGNFNTNNFGFQIITCKFGHKPQLKIVREQDHLIEVNQLGTSADSVTKFKHWHEKEQIFAYLDPSSYFASFYSIGLFAKEEGGEFTKLTEFEIYDQVLKGTEHVSPTEGNFWNKNRVYIVLRNEHNHTFNYYGDYDNEIQIAYDESNQLTLVNYYQNLWPIFIVENNQFTMGNDGGKNHLRLALPVGNNPYPFVNIINGYPKRIKPFRKLKGKKRFIRLNTDQNYTDEIHLMIPNREGLGQTCVINSWVILNYSFVFEEETIEKTCVGIKTPTNYYFDHVFSPTQMVFPYNFEGGISIKVFKEDLFLDQPETSKQYLANSAVVQDDYGKYFFLFATDRNRLFGRNRKYFSFASENSAISNHFISELETRFSFLNFEKKKLQVASEEVQVIESNRSIENFLDHFKYPSVDELFVLRMSNSELEIINDLITTNNLDHNYDIRFGFKNKALAKDQDDKDYIEYDLVLRGYVNSTQNIEATEINTNLKIYQHVS